jgi:predicted enzyme related to lactoylglutathione lyase
MFTATPNPVVHLELHTGNLPRACSFYAKLFGWRSEMVEVGRRPYLALGLGDRIEGGGVECQTQHPLWLPYVEVEHVIEATQHARRLGASVLLEPREGPAGWRSVIGIPAGGEIALWQGKDAELLPTGSRHGH